MVNDVKRDSEVRAEGARSVHVARGGIQKETLCLISSESVLAELDRRPGDVKADVGGIIRQRELMAIATAELNYRVNVVFPFECT